MENGFRGEIPENANERKLFFFDYRIGEKGFVQFVSLSFPDLFVVIFSPPFQIARVLNRSRLGNPMHVKGAQIKKPVQRLQKDQTQVLIIALLLSFDRFLSCVLKTSKITLLGCFLFSCLMGFWSDC